MVYNTYCRHIKLMKILSEFSLTNGFFCAILKKLRNKFTEKEAEKMTNLLRPVYHLDWSAQAQPMHNANILFCPERKSVPILAI